MEGRSTQVTSHRMALSVSADHTSLWDQVEFTGDASDFAWVLPIHGEVEVGVSSDLFFTELENDTSVLISSPPVSCGSQQGTGNGGGTCSNGVGFGAAATGTGGGAGEQEGVTVLQQQAVGPYDTVQLASTDPNALRAWLAAHGYEVPPSLDATLDAYVAEGFDFLAVRLSPGQGVQAMQPIRVTFPGASLDLPLRMVAAGTGSSTAVTLWILGEGRYETTSMPTFTILPNDLVWDWDAHRSNYAELRQAGLQTNGGKEWLVESATALSTDSLQNVVLATSADPGASGYGGEDPVAAAQADFDAATSGMHSGLFVTRLYAQLPRAAFAADLKMGASVDQSEVPRYLVAGQSVGDPCQQALACGGNGDIFGMGFGGAAASGDAGVSGSGCSVGDASIAGKPIDDTLALSFVAMFGAAVSGSMLRRRGGKRRS